MTEDVRSLIERLNYEASEDRRIAAKMHSARGKQRMEQRAKVLEDAAVALEVLLPGKDADLHPTQVCPRCGTPTDPKHDCESTTDHVLPSYVWGDRTPPEPEHRGQHSHCGPCILFHPRSDHA